MKKCQKDSEPYPRTAHAVLMSPEQHTEECILVHSCLHASEMVGCLVLNIITSLPSTEILPLRDIVFLRPSTSPMTDTTSAPTRRHRYRHRALASR